MATDNDYIISGILDAICDFIHESDDEGQSLARRTIMDGVSTRFIEKNIRAISTNHDNDIEQDIS